MRTPLQMLAKAYFNLALRYKFIIPAIAVIVVSFLSVGIYFIHDQRVNQETRLQEKAKRISSLLLSSNYESVWNVDLETLEKNCQAFFEDEEITRIVITDTFYGEDVLINLSKQISGSQDIVKVGDFVKGTQKVASLTVVFSNYYIERNLARVRNTLLILSVLVFLLMAGLIRVVSQIALKPLEGLMAGVKHIKTGDLTFRIPVKSQDELGQLAVSFNTMTDDLSMYNDHLQELVENRTAELKTANTHLYQEISERERAESALHQAKEAAETANLAKSDFLANMSHELRTPMNAILGFSELMRRDSTISIEQRDNLETIGRSGEHLLSLINDVLEFSKIEAGRITLHLQNFDLHHLLLGLKEMFRLRAQQKGLSLDFTLGSDVPQFIRTDQNKLRQILINLLGNAVKFTETGGITLSVTNDKPDSQAHTNDCFLHFEVIDTGMGVLKQEQDKIFDAFFQSDTQNLSQQGTGLGLPISRKFTELMDGILTVHSNGVTGSNFTFALPVQIAADADSDTDLSLVKHKVIGIEAGQPDIRLLVVEDNDNNRNLLVKLLQSVGFTVQEAVNGRDAIEVWKKWQPHLIWMDMRMPVMDGYQATSHIKNSLAGKDTVIIALTASAFEKDRLKVLAHGCNDFVPKPFREAVIFEMMHKYLGVQYVYEPHDEGLDSVFIKEKMSEKSLILSINNLPEELFASLKESTELCDADMIDQALEDIRCKNDQLADALSELAANFAYDKILALVQMARKTASDNPHTT